MAGDGGDCQGVDEVAASVLWREEAVGGFFGESGDFGVFFGDSGELEVFFGDIGEGFFFGDFGDAGLFCADLGGLPSYKSPHSESTPAELFGGDSVKGTSGDCGAEELA